MAVTTALWRAAHLRLDAPPHVLEDDIGLRLVRDTDVLATYLGLEAAVGPEQRALDLAHRQKERGSEAWVLRLLGEIAAHADPPDPESAEGHYRLALARAHKLGMRPLAAHCHLGLGTLYRRIGKREPAQEHLSTAATMYREMGMRFWLAKSEQEATASA